VVWVSWGSMWIWQHLNLRHKNRAVPVLVAGHAQGKLVIPTTTVFKIADNDLLELKRWWLGRTWSGGIVDFAVVLGCLVWTTRLDVQILWC